MQIARLSEKIRIEKSELALDKYGNQIQSWQDYCQCRAYADTYMKEESSGVAPAEQRTVTFQVRCCRALSAVTSDRYRILFRDEVYNIVSIDMMNYGKRTIRLTCRKEVHHGEAIGRTVVGTGV